MFQISPPLAVFSEVIKPDIKKCLSVYLLMRKEKFDSLSKGELKIVQKKMNIQDIKIKDPNEPSKLIDAKLISFSF